MYKIAGFVYDQQKLEHLVDVTLEKLCARFSENPDDVEAHIRVAMGEVQILISGIVGEREVAQEIVVLMQAAGLALGLPEYEVDSQDVTVKRINPHDKTSWWQRKRVILDRLVKDITNLIHFMEGRHG